MEFLNYHRGCPPMICPCILPAAKVISQEKWRKKSTEKKNKVFHASGDIQPLASSFFLGLHLRHMEVPRLRVESELQLPAYTTATATRDPSHTCNLCHSLWQHWIFNPLSEAGDRTCILMDNSRVLNLLSHNGNSYDKILIQFLSSKFL